MGLDSSRPMPARRGARATTACVVPDAVHDACCSATRALRVTTRCTPRPACSSRFPRAPMMVAIAAWDLAAACGRTASSSGSVRAVPDNIERRYSTPWTAPVRARCASTCARCARSGAAFQTGAALSVLGWHYQFTRLQPFFNPGRSRTEIPIFLGAVGAEDDELAGEVADGLMTHPSPIPRRAICARRRSPRSPRAPSARGATRTGSSLLAAA